MAYKIRQLWVFIVCACLAPSMALSASYSIPVSGFVPSGTKMGALFDFEGSDIQSVRIYSTRRSDYLGGDIGISDNAGFIPTSALERFDANGGHYFVQTASADGRTSHWRSFSLTNVSNGPMSFVALNAESVRANTEVALNELIDTSGLTPNATVEVGFGGEHLGFLYEPEIDAIRLSTPSPGETVELRLSTRLPGEGQSKLGRVRMPVKAAADASLTWSQPRKRENGRYFAASEVDHYEVAYGTASGKYDRTKETVNTETTLSNLKAGMRYYMAVRVYDSAGRVSDFSEEVSLVAR